LYQRTKGGIHAATQGLCGKYELKKQMEGSLLPIGTEWQANIYSN